MTADQVIRTRTARARVGVAVHRAAGVPVDLAAPLSQGSSGRVTGPALLLQERANLWGVIEMGMARTPKEREEVFRFWYSVYVEEMGRYKATADHVNRLLFGPEDDYSWLFFARDAGEVVASCRITWGGDGFTDRQIAEYRLQPFLAELPASSLAVGERAMVAASHRGGTLYGDLGVTTAAPQIEHGVLLTFGANEPHLVTFYAELGMRPYADRHAFSEESGYLIPNVVFTQGVEAFGEDPPACVRRVLRGQNAVNYAHQDGEARYLDLLLAAVAALPSDRSVFRGLTDEQVARCTERSLIVTCEVDDQILMVGGTARNPFVVLSGRLEARVDGRVTCELTPGALFGESGLLGNERRGADVIVTAPGTTILALSERALSKVMRDHPEIGSVLFANIANDLWSRLRDANLLSG